MQTALRQRIRAGLWAVAVAMLAGCDQNVSVSGVVRNQADAALEGVVVTLQTKGRAPDTTLTAADGSFAVGMIGADPSRTLIQFQKSGYQTLEKTLGPGARTVLNVTLTSLSTGTPPSDQGRQ